MHFFPFFLILIISYVSAIPGSVNYVAPSNSTRVLRQSENGDNAKNLEDVLGRRQEDSEDVGPLGEVQLDVEEEDIGESSQPKLRVRRGYSQPKPKGYSQPKKPPTKYSPPSPPKYY
ncbi:hypothetical protein CRE_26000 [Caenorhabditis remanei]|uniref:Uncharacterized protein n=2 Tax=Caenorhabditis remanei TaxID=31234 RepID=E3NRJ5_CAERE|nr:hypothetical protein CRE_26000 [Caenorhabditis remanei]